MGFYPPNSYYPSGSSKGPAGGKPVAPPRMVDVNKGRGGRRVLTAEQRRRRTIRQALGITDVRSATAGQIAKARKQGGLLKHGQKVVTASGPGASGQQRKKSGRPTQDPFRGLAGRSQQGYTYR